MNARRAAALLEVLGVFIVGQYLGTLFVSTLRPQIDNPLAQIHAQISNAELLFAARDLFLLFLMQYAGWFVLVIPINWRNRRTGPAAYGFTTAGRSWTVLLVAGIATAALSAWPAMSVQLLDHFYDLGPAVPWRRAIFDMSWRRWEFWLFSAVMSLAFVAFMEEIFFRGYCQRRLAEDWGHGPAIIGTACLFTFAHGQYLIANLYSVSLLASLFVLAIGLGVVFAYTRSLVPSVLAHAIINFPMTPRWEIAALLAFMVIAVVAARGVPAVIKQVFSRASVIACVALAVVGAGYAIASQQMQAFVYVAAGMLGLALGLEAMHRGRNGSVESTSISLD